MLSIVAVTANFGLYQPYPYYKRQGEADVLNKFLRIFLLQFIAYTVIGVVGAVCFHYSFELTAVCLLAPIQVLANQLSFMMMVEDVKFKNAIFFTARITNTLITIIAFYTMDRTISSHWRHRRRRRHPGGHGTDADEAIPESAEGRFAI